MNFEEPKDYPLEAEALRIFQTFTISLWEYLDSSKIRQSTPSRFDGVEDLLKFWTVPSRLDSLIHPQLTTTAGLDREAFASKFSVFFPPPKKIRNLGWRPMEESYIAEYWAAIRGRPDSAVTQIDDSLRKLLSFCQCLPNCDDTRGPWIPGSKGEIILLVNPGEYHPELLNKSIKKTRKKRKVTKSLAEFRQSLLGILKPHLTAHQKRRVARGFGRISKKIVRAKRAVEKDNHSSDEDQPPRPRQNTRRRGRGGKQLGRPRKIVVIEESNTDETSTDTSSAKRKRVDSDSETQEDSQSE